LTLAAAAASARTVKVLAVGNSFTLNATQYLSDIVKESGHELVMSKATIGGSRLEEHYARAMIHEADPEDAAGKPYVLKVDGVSVAASLKQMLLSQTWDFVTIQQASPDSYRIETYRPYARNLHDYIKSHAPQVHVVFHQTWAYREDDDEIFINGFDQEKMFQGLTVAYHTVAQEIGIPRIIPVGNAFRLAAESPAWRYVKDPNYDFINPCHPELPDQTHSLHAGYSWRIALDGGDRLSLDSHHANTAGQYLGGCVWFEFFFGEDVRTLPYTPKTLDVDDAEFLRNIAHQTVAESILPAAWPPELSDGDEEPGDGDEEPGDGNGDEATADVVALVVKWDGENVSYVSQNREFNRMWSAYTTGDFDNDQGGTPDDVCRYIPFDMTAYIKTTAGNYTGPLFYGGVHLIVYKKTGDFSHDASTAANNGIDNTAAADAIMTQTSDNSTTLNKQLRAAFLWAKADFLNGGSGWAHVGLNAASSLTLATTNLTSGLSVRFLVKNAGKLYVSNTSLTESGTLVVSDPKRETWAEVDNTSSDLLYLWTIGSYATRTFVDVEAIGYYADGRSTVSKPVVRVKRIEAKAYEAAATPSGNVIVIR
jgi:hypothetical protein